MYKASPPFGVYNDRLAALAQLEVSYFPETLSHELASYPLAQGDAIRLGQQFSGPTVGQGGIVDL